MEYLHQTFVIDAPFSEFDRIENLVHKSYGIDEYLIAFEATNDKGESKPHYHFIVFTTVKNLTNLIQKLVKDFNLATTTGKHGGRRKYARLKQPIKNLERLKIYCSKEGNVRSSYSEETLTDLYRKSFKKDDKALKLKCQSYVEAQTESQYKVPTEEIRLYIIEWCMSQKVHIRKTLVDAYLIWIVQNTEYTRLRKNKHEIYNLIF